MLDTPVLFIIFNRPESTKKVFSAIRQAKPRRLFIAADGPRKEKEGEAARCNETRSIVNEIDWDCEVKTLFREENRGCGVGPSEAMSWFFEHVDAGIILEDDCLPSQSFFTFCQEMLEKYEQDDRVAHIGGTNSQFGKKRGRSSYYFSKYPHIWGWATWKRAWNKFRFSFQDISDQQVEEVFNYYSFNDREKNYWREHWNLIKSGQRKDIWDIQWTFSCWLNHSVTIVPNYNLISNIGFDSLATHTTMSDSKLANLKTYELKELIHPAQIRIDKDADEYTFTKYNLLTPPLSSRIRSAVSNMIPRRIKDVIKSIIP